MLDNYRIYFFRLFITLFCLFIVIKIFLVFQSDIIGAYELELHKQEARLNKCIDEYNRNKCEDRVEALYSYCEEREICINTPVSARLKTLVATFGLIADVLNGFSERLTYSSIGLLALLILTVMVYWRFFRDEKEVKIELTVNGKDVQVGRSETEKKMEQKTSSDRRLVV